MQARDMFRQRTKVSIGMTIDQLGLVGNPLHNIDMFPRPTQVVKEIGDSHTQLDTLRPPDSGTRPATTRSMPVRHAKAALAQHLPNDGRGFWSQQQRDDAGRLLGRVPPVKRHVPSNELVLTSRQPR